MESNRILEYLDDTYPDKIPLFSTDANERAEQKFWMDHIGSQITPNFYPFLKDQDAVENKGESRDKMCQGLTSLAQAMSPAGPYFSGESVSAVDIAFLPFAYRIDRLLSHYRNFTLPVKGDVGQRYRGWYDAMLAQPAFKATATDHTDYESRLITHYLPYSQGGK